MLTLTCLAVTALTFTVVAGPPAAAALYTMSRAAVLHEHPDTALFITALKAYFARSWALSLVGLAGAGIWWVDLNFYLSFMRAGAGPAGWIGAAVLLYVGIVWLQTIFYAWPLAICREDLKIRQLLKNAFLISARYPLHNLVITAFMGLLFAASVAMPPIVIIAAPALVAILGLHNLYLLAPELVPGERAALDVVS